MSVIDKYKRSEELERMAIEALEIARDTGKIKKGINETTKAIERGTAKIVYFAGNIEPLELIMHIPILCEEKKVPCLVVEDKKKLGKTVGIDVPTSSVAIIDPGDGVKIVRDLINKLMSV